GVEHVLDISREGIKVGILLAAPLMMFGLTAGLVINVFQAVTQISEHTLAIVPKILAIFFALMLFAPWMIDTITGFTTDLFESIPSVVR
ncbi:unnamed protein product, partial [marine sediment metagenome]